MPARLLLALLIAGASVLSGCTHETRRPPAPRDHVLVPASAGMVKAFLLARWPAIGVELAQHQAGENLHTACVLLCCDPPGPTDLGNWWRLYQGNTPDAFAETLLQRAFP